MAEKNSPHRSINVQKADGNRWRSEEDTIEEADRTAVPGIGADEAEEVVNPLNEKVED